MNTKRLVRGLVPLMIWAIAGCGGSGGGDQPDPNGGGDGGVDSDPSKPPSAASGAGACVLSVDCPAGEHCDLGECVQACNDTDPCGAGLACSPRARCLPPGTPDEDPAPTSKYAGTLSALPNTVALTESDTKLAVQLVSSSSTPVRYRVELNAPHLSIVEARGEFTGSTTLTFDVDRSKLTGQDVAGGIVVHSSIGDVSVSAPIHVGLTGSYHGALRYDGGPVNLGNGRIAIDLLEKDGAVQAHVVPGLSLLFPKTPSGETLGQGSYTESKGLDITLVQRVDASVGKDRNRFARPIGRKLRLTMKPSGRGDLDGTFEETIYGLFSLPITLTGTVRLEYQPARGKPDFTMTDPPSMPPGVSKDSFLTPSEVFGWSDSSCDHVVCGASGCTTSSTMSAVLSAESTYSAPLNSSVRTKVGDLPFDNIADACTLSLGLHDVSSYSISAKAQACGHPVPLACAMPMLARLPSADGTAGKAFGRLVAETLAPELLVAKNHVVSALSDSFIDGVAKEKLHYDAALQVLAPAAKWVTQPSVLEYLRAMPTAAAKGDTTSAPATELDTYPAGRALGDLFYTQAMIDGERARIGAASDAAAQPELAQEAQERALMAFLEGATMSELLRAWGSPPPTVGVKVLGVLTPLDQGFAALSLGANAFGVPSGFVPFVYRPEDVKPTNFEQVLTIARDSVTHEGTAEATFITNKRTYESNLVALQSMLSGIRRDFDLRLIDLCGKDFKPDAVTSAKDWTKCGAGGTGEVAASQLDIQATLARLHSAQARLEGLKTKILIDQKALADSQHVHEDSLNFISSTGDKISALTYTTAMLDAEMSAFQVAAQASVVNFGAPMVEAGAILLLGTVKAGLEKRKADLQTALQMNAEASSSKIELINGMAAIQKEMVEFAQAGIDMQQDVVGLVQSNLRARNAVATAQSVWEERARVYSLVDKDPSNDPSYRILRDQQGVALLKLRADAQKQLYLAASALQYEINQPIAEIDGAVLNAHNHASLDDLASCLGSIYTGFRLGYGTPQDYSTTVSVRKLLGITGPRLDPVTGVSLTEGEQFRFALLQNGNVDGSGGVNVTFATDLRPGNGLWSSDVCNDRIGSMQAQLVGDFLGDNQAQVKIALSGNSILRTCGGIDKLETWSLGTTGRASDDPIAVLQAGVNSFGDSTPNLSLFGQAVARATWRLTIPSASSAPLNADVDVTKVDDVVLKITHKAVPQRTSPLSVDLSCLAAIGK